MNPDYTDPKTGLTQAEAERRAAAGMANTAPKPLTKTAAQIVRDNVCTYYNFLFLALGACLAAVGAYREMLFLLIVVCNTVIGIVQELRVRHTLEKISILSARTARAVRDGEVVTLPTDKLVQGDVTEFSAGDEICADGTVVCGQAEVNESLITGEADPVLKREGDTLLSGSFVVSGTCRAQLERVGAASYAAQLAGEARRTKKVRSEMMRSLDAWLRILGVAILPLGILMFTRQLSLDANTMTTAVTSTVAALVGMIPEGLYLLVSAALAVSVIQLARRRTLVRELSCIESLARADVICLDKTGTITAGELRVEQTVPCGNMTEGELCGALASYIASQTADNATARALRERFAGGEPLPGVREIPFSSERKFSALITGTGETWVLGAPENVLRGQLERYADLVGPLTAEGLRVVVLARGNDLFSETGEWRGIPEPAGFVAISDTLRPAASETLRYFAQQGVEVKVISGDSAAAVSRVALRAGVENAGRFADLSDVPDDADYGALARSNTVFGRVTPRQKQKLVRAMQADGHFVAMIGDGVNDVLALKDANCSVAMAGGADAAQQVSQLVLLDSDFSVMPQIVREGRRVINNVSRSAALFLVKNVFSFLVSFILLFVALPYPLQPLQIGLVSFLMIGAPSFLLTFEPTFERVRGHFLLRAVLNALPGGLANTSAILGIAAAGSRLGWTAAETSTVCTYLVCTVGILVLVFLCSPFTKFRAAVVGLMALGVIGCALFVPWFFGLAALTSEHVTVLTAAAAAACSVQCFLVWLFSLVRRRLDAAERTPRARARRFA